MSNEIAIGANFNIYYNEETTAVGTLEDTGTYSILGVTKKATFTPEKEVIKHNGIGSDHPLAIQYGAEKGKLDLELELTDEAETFIGNFDPASTEKQYSFILVGATYATEYHYSTYCVVDSVKLTANKGEPVTASISLICQDYTLSASDPLTTATYGTWTANDPALWTDTTATKSGDFTTDSSIDSATSVELELKYNVKARHHLDGNTVPRRIQRTNYEISGKISTDFESYAELEEVTSGTFGQMVLTFGGLTYTITNCIYEKPAFAVTALELIELELPFTGQSLTVA